MASSKACAPDTRADQRRTSRLKVRCDLMGDRFKLQRSRSLKPGTVSRGFTSPVKAGRGRDLSDIMIHWPRTFQKPGGNTPSSTESGIRFKEPITDPRLCRDEPRFRRIGFKFFPKVGNVDAQIVGLFFVIRSPYFAQDLAVS